MNKTIRILLAFVVFAGIVALGMSGTAWADKLNRGVQIPAASPTNPHVYRPGGTVNTNPHIYTLHPHMAAVVGSCTTVLIDSAAAGVTYTATIVPSDTLPLKWPGGLMSCVVRIDAKPATTMGADVHICFPIPPTTSGFAYYHDGSVWIKTAADAKDGQSCVIVPATAGDAVFAAMFDK